MWTYGICLNLVLNLFTHRDQKMNLIETMSTAVCTPTTIKANQTVFEFDKNIKKNRNDTNKCTY